MHDELRATADIERIKALEAQVEAAKAHAEQLLKNNQALAKKALSLQVKAPHKGGAIDPFEEPRIPPIAAAAATESHNRQDAAAPEPAANRSSQKARTCAIQ